MSVVIKACAWAVLGVMCTSQASHGQPPRTPLTPRPAHERLAAFEGIWMPLDSAAATLIESCSTVPSERHEVLDALRGLALFGILFVNLDAGGVRQQLLH